MSTSEYEKEKMQERMARLASGVAVLKVIKYFIPVGRIKLCLSVISIYPFFNDIFRWG